LSVQTASYPTAVRK